MAMVTNENGFLVEACDVCGGPTGVQGYRILLPENDEGILMCKDCYHVYGVFAHQAIIKTQQSRLNTLKAQAEAPACEKCIYQYAKGRTEPCKSCKDFSSYAARGK